MLRPAMTRNVLALSSSSWKHTLPRGKNKLPVQYAGLGTVVRQGRRAPIFRLERRRFHAPRSTEHHQQPIPPPTSRQIRAHFAAAAIPMIGFGFMDNTLMIQTGNAIDCTLGVAFGMSTLAAAACGQIASNAGSVLFGGTVERLAQSAGLPSPGLAPRQMTLAVVRRAGLTGAVCGVVLGCTLGLVNLWFIDTDRSATLKLQALTDEQEFAVEVIASNAERSDATVLTVRGPDVDGLLASMTAALAHAGCSLVELHASPRGQRVGGGGDFIEDVFVVRPRGGANKRQQIDNSELNELARKLLAASKDPLSTHSLREHVRELEETNDQLVERMYKLERELEDRQITVEPAAPEVREIISLTGRQTRSRRQDHSGNRIVIESHRGPNSGYLC